MLSSLDAKIIHAVNGLEAVDICKKDERIDLVLMDIKMPVMNGYKATEEIKKIRPDLPVIAQTAFSDALDKQKAFNSGCAELLPKPISKAKLLETVKKYLYQ
jgi:two-component system, cell cycle response regulator DivK